MTETKQKGTFDSIKVLGEKRFYDTRPEKLTYLQYFIAHAPQCPEWFIGDIENVILMQERLIQFPIWWATKILEELEKQTTNKGE